MILTSVDLPAPLLPINPTTSPGSRASDTSVRACTAAKMLGDILQFKDRHSGTSFRRVDPRSHKGFSLLLAHGVRRMRSGEAMGLDQSLSQPTLIVNLLSDKSAKTYGGELIVAAFIPFCMNNLIDGCKVAPIGSELTHKTVLPSG